MGQNPTDSQVNDMINEVDVDGSGVVEFAEFVNFFSRLMRNMNPENEVKEAFRRYIFLSLKPVTPCEVFVYRFDSENEGFVRLEEIKFVLSNLPVKLTEEEIREILDGIETDSEGKISSEQFKAMIGM